MACHGVQGRNDAGNIMSILSCKRQTLHHLTDLTEGLQGLACHRMGRVGMISSDEELSYEPNPYHF